ncbi:hypothetical protein JSE7799_01126 [Jannaschia seosinensis]|uniref:Uncharacterized protein n=1 Tax=Jannaschia seosinensis TaxID=313367 RepID=A0A0M7B7T8_9RHOB|nr:hypothetical protein JSE7799_01126 [Jannaschia seosinensis]
MADAITLARFYLSEAMRLDSAATVSAETSQAEALRRWLVEAWPHPDVTNAEVKNRGPNSLREAVKAHAALSFLGKHGWLVPLANGTVVRGKARNAAWTAVRGTGDVT